MYAGGRGPQGLGKEKSVPKIADLFFKILQFLFKNGNKARCLPVPSVTNIIPTYRLTVFGSWEGL